MEGLEKLLAEAEIKDLMYKRIRYMDTNCLLYTSDAADE